MRNPLSNIGRAVVVGLLCVAFVALLIFFWAGKTDAPASDGFEQTASDLLREAADCPSMKVQHCKTDGGSLTAYTDGSELVVVIESVLFVPPGHVVYDTTDCLTAIEPRVSLQDIFAALDSLLVDHAYFDSDVDTAWTIWRLDSDFVPAYQELKTRFGVDSTLLWEGVE